MNELGLVRVTEDIDLLIEASAENQQRVREALRILPDRAIDELGPEEDLRSTTFSSAQIETDRVVKAQLLKYG